MDKKLDIPNVNGLSKGPSDDFDLMCMKEIAMQKDYLTASDYSDAFSDISDTFSQCASADFNQGAPKFMYGGDIADGNVWEVGFNIGSNFLPNSFLCPSSGVFNSNYGSGLPRKEDSNKYALVPAGQLKNHQEEWQEHLKKHNEEYKNLTSKELAERITKEYLKAKIGTSDAKDDNIKKIEEVIDSKAVPIMKGRKAGKKKSRRNLSLREDVMNKNILRALKRELITMYEAFESTNPLASFREKIRDFCEHLLFTSTFSVTDHKSFNKTEFYAFVGILINYCKMKKLVKNKEEREQLRMCYEVIYSYSHSKFNEFVQLKEVAAIIKIVVSSIGIDNIIANNESLQGEYADKYREHIAQMLEDLSV